MRCVNATNFHRKSGGAQPTCPGVPWRDLQFRATQPLMPQFLKMIANQIPEKCEYDGNRIGCLTQPGLAFNQN